MKPEWCPQELWDEACKCMTAWPLSVEGRSRIARALLDAHQRGRREGMEEAATMIDEGVEKPASSPWRNDGKPSKHDKCPHDLFMYEDCETCCASAIRAKADEVGT